MIYYSKSFDLKMSPLAIFKQLRDEKNLFFLHSSYSHKERGRYSFLGFDPFKVVYKKGSQSLEDLKKNFKPFQCKERFAHSPLGAGIVGVIGYDWGLTQEKIKLRNKLDLGLPDVAFGFYDCIVTFDHLKQKIWISSTGMPEKNSVLKKKLAHERLKAISLKIEECLKRPLKKFAVKEFPWKLKLKSSFSKNEFIGAVKKSLEYIRQGDIYQLNLSQGFSLDFPRELVDCVQLYDTLVALSPAPFGGFWDADKFKIISSSPEKFLSLNHRQVETRPMKGTRPRSRDVLKDQKFKKEILNSKKEQAELLMITDLERNDLGRVCETGSVKVKVMRELEKYKTVYQTTSTVTGLLSKGLDAFDLIRQVFPSGSVTGCPKIRAMEIIEELEPTRRNVYTGSFGFMSFAGDCEFNILIRTLLCYKNKIYFQTGSGIVADSKPSLEYSEMLLKAKAIVECLQRIHEK